MDYKYNYNYLEIANNQLLKGGVHLAGLLKKFWVANFLKKLYK